MNYPTKIRITMVDGQPFIAGPTEDAQEYIIAVELQRSARGIMMRGSIDGLRTAVYCLQKTRSFTGGLNLILSTIQSIERTLGKANAEGLSDKSAGGDTPALSPGNQESSAQNADGGGQNNGILGSS